MNMFEVKRSKRESGNAVVIVLVALVVVAVGVLAYLSMDKDVDEASVVATASSEPASGEEGGAPQEMAEGSEGTVPALKPGNPVVAKVNGKTITRLDVFNYVQTLPQQTRQLPIDQLFPIAMEQVISAGVVNEKAKGVNMDNDPEVKAQLAIAKEQITRAAFIQKKVRERITQERLEEAYESYKANFPEVEEVKGRHILVDDESEAKDLIKQLNDGADFAELAKAHSKDTSAQRGGDIGYFFKDSVVPEFGKAAFALEPGTYTKKPVKTEFGYHIIKSEEKRIRPPATFEQAKPDLENQLARIALDELVQSWKKDADIERFDINGEPVESAAGDEAAAPEAAE